MNQYGTPDLYYQSYFVSKFTSKIHNYQIKWLYVLVQVPTTERTGTYLPTMILPQTLYLVHKVIFYFRIQKIAVDRRSSIITISIHNTIQCSSEFSIQCNKLDRGSSFFPLVVDKQKISHLNQAIFPLLWSRIDASFLQSILESMMSASILASTAINR